MPTSLTNHEIRAFGLRGSTPEGGWSHGLRPEDCVYTLIAAYPGGLEGWGSVFTNDDLVRAALAILRPLFEGENALEPERVGEKLHQHTFWQGRGGKITHTISGIDLAPWDILGQACGQPVGRLRGGRYRERVRLYASLLMREPERMPDELLPVKAQGFRGQNRLGAFREVKRRDGGRHRTGRAESRGFGFPPHGGRRRERCVMAAGLQVGAAHCGDAGERRSRRFEEPTFPMPSKILSRCAAPHAFQLPGAKS